MNLIRQSDSHYMIQHTNAIYPKILQVLWFLQQNSEKFSSIENPPFFLSQASPNPP